MSSVLDAGRGAETRVPRERGQWATALRSGAAAWVALAVLVIATGALLYRETRGTTLFLDEWTWLLHRRGNSLASFLDTHNGHLSLIPVAIYKLLFATAGIGSFGPYRALVIVAHLACCVLLFVYARARVGPLLALLAAALLLLFGPGWENMMWPFQTAFLLSLGAGLGALLALDRLDRAGDVTACVLLTVSLASSGVGVPFVLGVALELGLRRRRLGDAWIVAVPLLLYALWWVGYQHTGFRRHDIVLAPSFVYSAASATLSALAGLAGSTGLDGQGTLMTWGPALLVAAIVAVAWRLVRIRRLEPRVAALATMALSFWLLTALSRAYVSSPFASRYLYVGAFFVLLLAVELLRGVSFTWWSSVVVGVAGAAAIVSNVGELRDAGRMVRGYGQDTTADLGALEIGRPVIPPGYVAQQVPGYPFVVIPAASYFAATRSVGSPAATPAQILADPESVRASVDAELIHIHRLGLLSVGHGVRLGSPPAVDSVTGGATAARGGCVIFAPDHFIPAGTTVAFAVTVPAEGLELQASAAPATVGVRRFADAFSTLGTVTPGGPVALLVAPDRSSQPWRVQLESTGRVAACGLRLG